MHDDWAQRRSLYLQVRDALVGRVANGTWKPTSIIPGEQDLARELGVSAGTVRKALDLMEAEGLVMRRQGRGTFVNDRVSDGFAARFSNLRDADGTEIFGQIQSSEVAEGAATALEQERLHLSQGEIVYRIHRTRAHIGRIFMVEDTSLPAALFAGLAKAKSGVDELTVLAREHRILLGTSEERVSAVMPSTPIASTLGVAPGAAVMLLDRVVRMLDGDRPVEWRVAFCHLPAGHYLTKTR